MYKQKYLKYKDKYLTLKNQLAGSNTNGIHKASNDIINNIGSFSSCKEGINLLSSNKNLLANMNFTEINDSFNVKINIDETEVNLLGHIPTICTPQNQNNEQINECKRFYNKCKLLHLYNKYFGNYTNELVNGMVLNNMMFKTFYLQNNNDQINDQRFLISLGATRIGYRDFNTFNRNYFVLTQVIIPDGIQVIGSNAFINNNIRELIIPSTVTSINSDAFANNKINQLNIPHSVQFIGGFTNNQITELTIPSSVTTIGDRAFEDNQLTQLTIEPGVTTIGMDAFMGNQLTQLDIPSTVTFIDDGAFSWNKLTQLTIPSSVTTIGGYAFVNNQLTQLTIPSSVTSIGPEVFVYNPLTHLTIPNRFRDDITSILGKDDLDGITITYTD